MPGILHILFYLIPSEAYDQILEALARAGYAPQGSRIDDPFNLNNLHGSFTGVVAMR